MKNERKTRSIVIKILSMLIVVSLAIQGVPVTVSGAEWFKGTTKEEKAKKGVTVEENSPIFQNIDKAAFKKAKHKERMLDEELLNTYVFKNEDGTKTVYHMYEDVKYIDENGEIIDKDISLKEDVDGYKTAKNNVELFLPDDLSEGVEVGRSEYSIKVIPQGISDVEGIPQEDNSLVYEKVFSEYASLKYTPLLSGVKEDIVLTEYISDASFDFILETDGLILYDNDKGCYLAENQHSDVVFHLGEVIVYDAVGSSCFGEMKISPIEEGQKYLLTLSVADEYLADEMTVYPVTIDPTLTVSDEVTGDGAIVDAPIFKGLPTRNFGKYKYNTVGTTTASYGIGRTVVKLPGLYESEEYQLVNANDIESVMFYVKDTSGTGSQFINLHPLISNTSWTETTVTWNTVGSYSTAVNYGASLSSGKVTGFDITGLMRKWKDDIYDEEAGFILINSDETRNKSFGSSEYSTSAYKPYLVMTYSPAVSMNTTQVSVNEGNTTRLSIETNLVDATVSWSSNDSSIASVDSLGRVTGKKAGKTVVSARVVSNGEVHTVTCTVYVSIPSGVYYIKNMNSKLYLTTKNGYISNLSDVVQMSKYSTSANQQYRLAQMWKVYYLGQGRYSVRPLHKSNMGLDVTDNVVDIFSAGNYDSISSVPQYTQWTIERFSGGYVFKNKGNSSLTMMPSGASTSSGAQIIADDYTSATSAQWALESINNPPSGMFLYNTSTERYISGTISKSVPVGDSRTLSSMKICAEAYSGEMGVQAVSWESSNPNVATVNKSTGEVTGVAEGTVTIKAYQYLDGVYRSVFYNLMVVPFADGTYYIKNREYRKYLQVDNNLMEQWEYTGEDCQRWTFTSLENGYYKIISEESGMALAIKSGQTAAQDVTIVQEAYNGTTRQQWKITKTSNNSYKIKARSAESSSVDLAMAVGNVILGDFNGIFIQQREYVNNDNYKDEWYIGKKRIFNATANQYFDLGYSVRFGETIEESKEYILRCITEIAKVYEEEFGLQLDYKVEYYESPIDKCKGVVTAENLDIMCKEDSDHTNIDNVEAAFQDYCDSSVDCVNAYWTAYALETKDGEEANTSHAIPSKYVAFLTGKGVGNRENRSLRGLFHELNHLFGAPDHYHENGVPEGEKCEHAEICTECGSDARDGDCIMGPEIYCTELFSICEECKNDIMAYLIAYCE